MRARAEVVRVALLSVLLVSAAALVACGGTDGTAADPAGISGPELKLEAITVDDPLYVILDRALQDEYRAEAIYELVVDTYGELQPFSHIEAAEGRHVAAVTHLFVKRGVEPAPEWNQDDYGIPVDFPEDDFAAACALGFAAEQENVAMYTELIASGVPADVESVFLKLQSASQYNHLPAFERCM